MNRIRIFTLIAVAAAALISSCAKEEQYSSDERLTAIFDAWVEQYGEGAVKKDEGIYMKLIEEGQKAGASSPRENDWVKINYTMRNLSPVVSTEFATRYSDVASRLGISKLYTHYEPEYVQFHSGEQSMMMLGIYNALKYMKEGDKYRVYIPSGMAFQDMGSELYMPNVYGYSSQYFNIGGNTHIIVDLELVAVIPNPETEEVNLVRRYATEVMGLSLTDTLAENVYKRTLFYSSNDDEEEIGTGVSILYRYMGAFFDGFIFDTNIADSAINKGQFMPFKAYDLMATTTGGTIGMTIETLEPSIVLAGLDSAFVHMRYGEVAEVVMTSASAYGSDGSYPADDNGSAVAATVIQPYTPLRFVIQAAPKYGNGTKTFPYTVKGLRRDGVQQNVWFWGYVVGAVHGNDISQTEFKYTRDRWNVVLGESGTTTNYDDCIAIELPAGKIREELNLPSSIKRYAMRVLVRGDAVDYMGTVGIVNISEYKVVAIYNESYDAAKLYPESEWID